MVWDLRGALLKKEERESARLLDFEFRLRARTFRLVAERLGVDPAEVARRLVREGDGAVLAWLSEVTGQSAATIAAAARDCGAQARRRLVKEMGDPRPVRLL